MFKKIIIFDLDDTLISERQYIESGFNVISEILSIKNNVSKENIKNKMDILFEENPKNIFNRILDELSISYNQEDIIELINIYRNHIPKINLYSDAKEILEYLLKNEYKMGIITDGYKETQRNKLKTLDIDSYFEYIIVTDELGKEFWKPSEVPYRIMKKNFQCEFEDMVYIGDNPQKDFISPNRLGMLSIQIEREEGIYKKIEVSEENYGKIKVKNLNEIKSFY